MARGPPAGAQSAPRAQCALALRSGQPLSARDPGSARPSSAQAGLLYEPRAVALRDLPATLRAAAAGSRVRHVLVVGARHEPRESVTLGSRLPSGRIEGPPPLSPP